MPKGIPIDVDAVHAYLFSKTDRLGRVKIRQKELGEHLGHAKFTISRLVARLEDEGRIRKISSGKKAVGMFIVEEPEVWKLMNNAAAEAFRDRS